MMEQQGPANAQQPDRLGQLERRMSGVEGQLRGVSKQISVLTWAMGLGFTVVLVVVGWMWSSMTSDIGALRGEMGGLRGEMGGLRGEMGELRGEMGELRGDVVDLQRALPAVELRLIERIHSLDRQLSERIHSLERQLGERIHRLELAFTRAGIELGPLPPGENRFQAEPEPGSGPAEQGPVGPLQEDDN